MSATKLCESDIVVILDVAPGEQGKSMPSIFLDQPPPTVPPSAEPEGLLTFAGSDRTAIRSKREVLGPHTLQIHDIGDFGFAADANDSHPRPLLDDTKLKD